MGRLLGEWVPLEKKEAPVACKDTKESASSGPTLQYYRRGHAQCLPSSESRSRMCLSAGHQRQRGLPHPTLKAKRKHFPSKRCSKSLPTNGHRHLGSESQTFVTATGSKVERSSAPNQSRHNKNNNALPVENIAQRFGDARSTFAVAIPNRTTTVVRQRWRKSTPNENVTAVCKRSQKWSILVCARVLKL